MLRRTPADLLSDGARRRHRRAPVQALRARDIGIACVVIEDAGEAGACC
ncbi:MULTISPECIES: hypothetical protein [Streptomyces]|uniref:Uncharacterized protein n=1 Tax=Streptomyces halstedii TaxID=1944 RepID=A0A6N9U2U4_STRHA|nr:MULTISPECIES: hypothetical protein [Streptomyces]NEA16902.1 hypothetical protein [Streptomyces halstedii]